jgi:hypothetical protein
VPCLFLQDSKGINTGWWIRKNSCTGKLQPENGVVANGGAGAGYALFGMLVAFGGMKGRIDENR